MERKKVWWTVVTDCGTRRSLAVSRGKAIRNVKYRLVMDDRSYSRPRPRDFAEMREIEILEITPDGAPRIEPPSALATLGGYGESGRRGGTPDGAPRIEPPSALATPDGAGESGRRGGTPDGAPRIEPPSALATLGGYGESGRQNPMKG